MLKLNEKEFSAECFIQFDLLIKYLVELNDSHKDLQDRVSLLEQNQIKDSNKANNLESKLQQLTINTDKQFKNTQTRLDDVCKTVTKKLTNSKEDDEFLTSNENNDDEEEDNDEKEEKSKENESPKEVKKEENQDKPKEEEKKEDKQEKPIEEKKEEVKKEEEKNKDEQKNEEEKKDNDELNSTKTKKKTFHKEDSTKFYNMSTDENAENFLEELPLKKDQINKANLQDIEKDAEKQQEIIDVSSANEKNASPELLKMLFKRVFVCEKQIQELDKFSNKLSDQTFSLQNNDKKILNRLIGLDNKYKQEFKDLEQKYSEIYEDYEILKDAIEAIKVKLSEINVFELFKDNGNGTIDATKVMIQALENKLLKKMSIEEDKVKDFSTTIIKIKKVLNANKNVLSDLASKNNFLRGDFEALKLDYKNNQDNVLVNFDDQDKKQTDNYNKLVDLLMKIKGELNSKIQNINEALSNKLLNSGPKQIERIIHEESHKEPDNEREKETDKRFTEMNERLSNVEYALIKVKSSKDLDDMKKKLKALEYDVTNRLQQRDLYDLYDTTNKNKQLIQESKDIIDLLNEENKKRINDISSIWRKLESTVSTIAIMQQQGSKGGDQQSGIDISRFIDSAKFMDSTKALYKEIDGIKKLSEENARDLFTLRGNLRQCPTNEQMEILENKFTAYLNEYKLTINKKYADKTEMNRNIKILEAQIKALTDENSKKEYGDNWLLAKRPYGYKCASCEAELENLNNNQNDYLPWKKYPLRDENKSYRLGAGFSHILQMMSSELVRGYDKDNANNNNNGLEDEKLRGHLRCNSGSKKRLNLNNSMLPKVKLAKGHINLNEDIPNLSDDEGNINGNTVFGHNLLQSKRSSAEAKPKILKITKMKKIVKSES